MSAFLVKVWLNWPLTKDTETDDVSLRGGDRDEAAAVNLSETREPLCSLSLFGIEEMIDS